MGNEVQPDAEKKEGVIAGPVPVKEEKRVESSDLELLLKHNNSIQQVRSLIADLEIRKSQLINDFNTIDQRMRQAAEVALEKVGIKREEMQNHIINLDTGIVGPRPQQDQNI